MNRTLAELDREWTDIERRPTSVEALRRWAHTEPAVAGYPSLGAVLKERKSHPAAAPAMLAALARLAANDDLAARTLLLGAQHGHQLVADPLAVGTGRCR